MAVGGTRPGDAKVKAGEANPPLAEPELSPASLCTPQDSQEVGPPILEGPVSILNIQNRTEPRIREVAAQLGPCSLSPMRPRA